MPGIFFVSLVRRGVWVGGVDVSEISRVPDVLMLPQPTVLRTGGRATQGPKSSTSQTANRVFNTEYMRKWPGGSEEGGRGTASICPSESDCCPFRPRVAAQVHVSANVGSEGRRNSHRGAFGHAVGTVSNGGVVIGQRRAPPSCPGDRAHHAGFGGDCLLLLPSRSSVA